MSFSLNRRLSAEALGTALLVCAVVGSGIMAERLTEDVALALLCNTIATGAILVVLITMLGPLSGAQFNPAVSVALALRGRMPWGELPAYVAAQIAGGLVGAGLAHAMFELPVLQASATIRSGGSQWLAEVVATFGLVGAILAALRFRPEAVAWTVGLYITAAYWFTASTSFANPAVAVARGFTDTFSGIRPADVPGFVAAELAGAVLAALVFGWLLEEAQQADSQPSEEETEA